MVEGISVTRTKYSSTQNLGDEAESLGRTGGTGNEIYDDDLEETLGGVQHRR